MLKSVLCYYSDVYKLVKAFKKVVWYGADAAAIAADKNKKKKQYAETVCNLLAV